MIKTFFNVNIIPFLVSEGYYDTGSIDGFLQELDREKAKVVIAKEFRKFKKPTTVIKGLESMTDVASITKELKIKLGVEVLIKMDLLFCRVIIELQPRTFSLQKELRKI